MGLSTKRRSILRPRRLRVMTGSEARFSHACAAIAAAVHGGQNVLLIDAGNACNVYWLSRIARWMGLRPDDILSHVFLARAFTCYQTTTLLEKLPELIKEHKADSVVVVGLLDTYFDEQVPLERAVELLRQSLKALEVARKSGKAVVVIQRKDARYSGPRLAFFKQLYQQADGELLVIDE